MSPSDCPPIGPASPERAIEAFSLLFRDLSDSDRDAQVASITADVRSRRGSLAGLLEARREGRLVGAVFSQVQPGKAALLWPPRLAPGEPASTAAALVSATERWLAGQPVRVAHALVESVTEEEDAVLRGGGYRRLADLLYLVCPEDALPREEPSGPLEFETYCPANHTRLAGLVEATYRQTLDCPALNGVRQIEDVLAGYRAAGQFAADRWLIVRHAGSDVGCLLLADHAEQENWELVYMGLRASSRGQGWGMTITRRAQWMTRAAGRRQLVLAVDAANAPAKGIYEAAGFQTFFGRAVYLKTFDAGR